MPLDEDARLYLEGMADRPRAYRDGPEAARNHLESLAEAASALLPTIYRSEDHEIEGPSGPITLRVLQPLAEPGLPVLVWFHGGGWVTGSHRTHDGVLRPIANAVPCVAVIVDYRRAPEHPFPAAYDDCLTTLEWVGEHAHEIGGDADRIAVGGDSAGGNLAAAVAIAARDEGIELALQVLVYPVVDDDLDRPSMIENATGYGLEREAMKYFLDAYTPDAASRTDWRALPMKARELRMVAPARVLTAEFDPLRDEGEAYAAKLREQSVPVALTRYEGLIHGFFGAWGLIPAAQPSFDEVVLALQSAFEGRR